MLRFKTLRLAGIAATLSASGAFAADMIGYPPPPPPPMVHAPAPLDVSSGFYLRGDVGVGLYDYGDLRLEPPLATASTLHNSMNGTAFIGVGGGYQFNSFLRADATIEYRAPSKFSVTEQIAVVPPGYNITRGKVSGIVGLANAYVDLGTWHRITPFIGAGVGFATMMTSNVRDTGYGAFAGGSGSAANKTETRFAWAAHAGLGYDLSSNLKAEVAYRYLHIGDVNTARVVCTVPCAAFNARIKNLSSHDVKFGLRYVFADAPVAYAPGPLMRKY